MSKSRPKDYFSYENDKKKNIYKIKLIIYLIRIEFV